MEWIKYTGSQWFCLAYWALQGVPVDISANKGDSDSFPFSLLLHNIPKKSMASSLPEPWNLMHTNQDLRAMRRDHSFSCWQNMAWCKAAVFTKAEGGRSQDSCVQKETWCACPGILPNTAAAAAAAAWYMKGIGFQILLHRVSSSET